MSAIEVTVIMPAYNVGPHLLPAVQSILDQTFQDFELLLIDDGSTDGSTVTISKIDDARIRIVKNEHNIGIINTRNKGIALARGSLLAMLDGDDIAKPERLAKQVATFRANPQLALLGTAADLIDGEGRVFDMVLVPPTTAEIKKKIVRGNVFIQSSIMMRKDAVMDLGGYSTEFPVAEDYALWLKFAEKYEVANLNERLTQYRVHAGQISQTKIKLMREMANKVQEQAWLSIVDKGLENEFSPPIKPSLRKRLRARENTLGKDYMVWVNYYRKMGNRPAAIKTALSGLRVAPLSTDLFKKLLITLFNR